MALQIKLVRPVIYTAGMTRDGAKAEDVEEQQEVPACRPNRLDVGGGRFMLADLDRVSVPAAI